MKLPRILVAIGIGLTAVGCAGGDDDDGGERAISGTALDKASAAALDHTGGGRVTETETGDEESFYEVEVTLDDGSQVDVHLDASFAVLGDEAEGPNEEDER